MNRYAWTDHKGAYPEGGQHWCAIGDCGKVCLSLFKSRTLMGKMWLCPSHHTTLQLAHDLHYNPPVKPTMPAIRMIRG